MPRLPKLGFVFLFAAAAATVAGGETFLIAPDDAPHYQLHNLRIEDDRFGRTALVFDYTRTREGTGPVRVAGRSDNGPLQISFGPNLDRASGEVRLGKMFRSEGGGYNYEFYFVSPAYWAGDFYGNCLISNKVRMGSPGPSISARPWNAEERGAYEKQQLADTPPSSPPDGYEAVTAGTKLVPGMPILAGRYADWAEAEVLALGPASRVTIRYADQETADTVDRDRWLAVDPADLRRAKSDPGAFRPSMRVLPGGEHPLPRDAEPIAARLELSEGVPLLLCRAGQWEDVFVLEDRGPTITVRYDESIAKFDRNHKRTELAIRSDTLAKLQSPGGARRFAKAFDEEDQYEEREITISAEDEWGRRRDTTYHVHDRNHPIKARIPPGAVPAPTDVELPEGVPVAYCWAREWQAATLLADRGRKLIVREDDHPGGFAWRLKRDQVIIEKNTLRKIARKQRAKTADLKQTLRTWTDASGEHKVEARFVRLVDGKVTLKTDAGREIKLPLDRLCDEDQELLKAVGPATDNPFE